MWVSGLFLCWQLLLDGYSVGFIFFSRLCYPLRFQNSTQARLWDGFLLFGSFSSCTTPSQGQVSIPNSLSLFLSFIFCPTSFWREWAAFLGDWCPLSAFRSLFCGSCSAFKWSFGEFFCGRESGFPVPFLHHLGTPLTTPILFSQSLQTAILLSVSRNLPALDTSSKWSHVISVPLWPASYFT